MKTITIKQINDILTVTNVIKYTGVAVIILTVLYNILNTGFVPS